jgi:hypothetical protein
MLQISCQRDSALHRPLSVTLNVMQGQMPNPKF